MKNSKFTENRTLKILKENEQGNNVPELTRELGVDRSTIYY